MTINHMTVICNFCEKEFSSIGTLKIHKREKHTFNKTIQKTCPGCNNDFQSVKGYITCEECRELRKKLNSLPLVHDTYIYGNNKER